MRGVVGRDCVDRPVPEAHLERGDVIGGPQRRVHLERRVEGAEHLVGQREVMRGGLGSDPQSVRLGLTHECDRSGGGQVQEVHPRPREPGEFDVAEHHQFLGHCGPAGQAEVRRAASLVHHCPGGEACYFAVLCEHDVKVEGVLHDPAHEERVLNAISVVGEQPYTAGCELRDGGHTLAGPLERQAAGGKHLAEPCLLAPATNLLHDRYGVLRGLGVGHGDDRREPTQCRCARAGLHRLGLLAPRLAEVHVEVDKAGGNDAARGIENTLARQVRTYLADPPAGDCNVALAGPVRVHDRRSLDHPLIHH